MKGKEEEDKTKKKVVKPHDSLKTISFTNTVIR